MEDPLSGSMLIGGRVSFFVADLLVGLSMHHLWMPSRLSLCWTSKKWQLQWTPAVQWQMLRGNPVAPRNHGLRGAQRNHARGHERTTLKHAILVAEFILLVFLSGRVDRLLPANKLKQRQLQLKPAPLEKGKCKEDGPRLTGGPTWGSGRGALLDNGGVSQRLPAHEMLGLMFCSFRRV